jgi:hypothetical protein
VNLLDQAIEHANLIAAAKKLGANRATYEARAASD